MILFLPELGNFALMLALAFALVQASVPLYAARTSNNQLMQWARPLAYAQFYLLLLSFICLASAFLENDFSVLYVAQNSNTAMPWYYRLSAVWGAHEGSLLLWVFILTLWMALVAKFSTSLPLQFVARVLSVMAWVAVGFYFFILLTSNPFLRILPNIPSQGSSLNPLLQDPGLVSHPPILYMGYVGFSVAFAFAIAALIGGELDKIWAKWMRPWTLAAWSFLTLGIVLGSWWSYRELGWGGWWFWDPVENASFMPWLVGTALIHSLIVTSKRDAFKAWTVLLAICAFSLSLLGTFLVRSGILVSVHAFAVDPLRGTYVLGFLTLVIGLSLLLYTYRAKKLQNKIQLFANSRETFLLINNVILFVGMLTVLLGTLYPLMVAILHWGQISVGAPYFNTVFLPLMVPLFIFMGVAPYFYWERGQMTDLARHCCVIALLALIMSALLLKLLAHWQWQAFFGASLGMWLFINTLYMLIRQYKFKPWSITLAHLGMAVTTLGIVLSVNFSHESQLRMNIGDSVLLDNYQFKLNSVSNFTGPNYHGAQALVTVTQNGKWIANLYPQQRIYEATQTVLAKVAIEDNGWRDIYVALGTPIGKDAWGLRMYIKPFVRWIWYGGILMALGGFLAIARLGKRP